MDFRVSNLYIKQFKYLGWFKYLGQFKCFGFAYVCCCTVTRVCVAIYALIGDVYNARVFFKQVWL